MKKIILTIAPVLLGLFSYGQTNTFPTSGNVGIGTTTPASLLSLSQTTNDDGNLTIADFNKVIGSHGGSVAIKIGNSTVVSTYLQTNSLYLNTGVQYGTFGDSNFINSVTDVAHDEGNINFITAGANRMTIGGGVQAGNIGIGTANPTSLLHLQSSSIVPMLTLAKAGTITWKVGNFDQSTDNGFTVGFNATKAFYINTSGNIGIGTTSPTYPLTVGTPATSLGGEQASITYFPTTISGAYGGTVSQTMATPTANSSAIYYGMFGESGDNIGVTYNLTNSLGLVSLAGSVVHRGTGAVTGTAAIYAATPLVTNGGTITNAYGLYVNTMKASGVTNGYGVYQASANDLNYFAGNLGVGITTPASALHVIDNTTPVSGTSGMLPSTSTTANGSVILGATGTNLVSTMGLYAASGVTPYYWIQPRNAASAAFYNTVLNPNGGAVAIGTSKPATGYLLSVNGSAMATAVTVQVNANWPDYVFNKDYKLPGLKQVKEYIERNHHLPDMPGQEEIARNGLNLGEINKQLTRKVEELTLYVIEQKKQIDEQKKINQSLQDQINALAKQISDRKQ